MSIERGFDVSFVARMALREKQIQQNYRPIIAVHKWFARRPGTLFRGIILSEFVDDSLQKTFYQSNDLKGVVVADPFMGGGTPVLEANRLGCDVLGFDINPMAYWIVREEIEDIDLEEYTKATSALVHHLRTEVGALYRTRCSKCRSPDAQVKYFIWVKTLRCSKCGESIDLFPGYLLAQDKRHPLNVFICPNCGDLNERSDRKQPGKCSSCSRKLSVRGPARNGRCVCPFCSHVNSYPRRSSGPLRHRMFAIEYYCPICKPDHTGRFFKKPDPEDLQKFAEADRKWRTSDAEFVPDDEILPGDESDRLHRWGYIKYLEMFNSRQLLGLELSCRHISTLGDARLHNALATNLSDLLRYQNMLCRYDKMALKSLDIFSVHGFPVGLIQCESNLLGILNGAGNTVGSGGWLNIIEKYRKAKRYCRHPFEHVFVGKKKQRIYIDGEWIGRTRDSRSPVKRAEISCESSISLDLPEGSLDAVLTDPPYFGNVQYAELMDFCYVWLRRLVHDGNPEFSRPSTRNPEELTGNLSMDRGLEHFAAGLSNVYCRMARSLKRGHPFVFTYHHNKLEAYLPIAVALLDAELICTASFPCPAEMGGSIHIHGTDSSIVDTVFVCRSTGRIPRRWIVDSSEEISALVRADSESLEDAGMKVSAGDLRCIAYGHLIRLAIWRLRLHWDRALEIQDRISRVSREITALGGIESVSLHLRDMLTTSRVGQLSFVLEEKDKYEGIHNEIAF